MHNITYILQNKEIDNNTKNVITRIISIIAGQIDLPNDIQIEFKKLDNSSYGETSLNPRYKNRITLNSDLDTTEIIKPLIHELVHLHQLHTNTLSIRRDGVYIWNNKTYRVDKVITYENYLKLPWEADVIEKQKMLYKVILEETRK